MMKEDCAPRWAAAASRMSDARNGFMVTVEDTGLFPMFAERYEFVVWAGECLPSWGRGDLIPFDTWADVGMVRGMSSKQVKDAIFAQRAGAATATNKNHT